MTKLILDGSPPEPKTAFRPDWLQRFAEGAAGEGAPAAGGSAPAAEEAPAGQDEPLKEKAGAEDEAEEDAAEEAVDEAEAEVPEVTTEEVPEEAEEPAPEPETVGGEAAPTLEERLAALEEAMAKQGEMLLRQEQDIALRRHFSGMEQQAEAMKESFPDFDLRQELSDPVFVRLTSPMVGLSVEDAYYAIHHREITQAGARAAAGALGNSVQAGRSMPSENGSIQRGTPEAGYRPLAELSPEERKLRMDMIRSGKLRFD